MSSKEALIEALSLKDVIRAGWLRSGVEFPESVASHSWGMAFIGSQICPAELDKLRVLEMCIVHDLAEVKVGDITPHDGISVEEKHALESEAIDSMEVTEKTRQLFEEYETQSTPESKFVRFLDKLDMALQAEIYEKKGMDLSEFKKTAISLAEQYGFEW